MTQEPQSERFSDRHNITVGKARVIYGPRNVGWSTMNVYHLPGQQITTSRDHAHAVAVRMDKLMMGQK